MLTKNFDKIMALAFGFLKNGDTSNIDLMLTNTSGASVKSRCSNSFQYYALPAGLTDLLTSIPAGGSGGVAFGNGTAQPTKNDYTLSGSIFNTVSVATKTSTSTVDGNTVTVTKTYYLNNTGATDFTISEVATFASGAAVGCAAMIDRTLLDSPVTISSGGVGKIVYSVSMTIPEA